MHYDFKMKFNKGDSQNNRNFQVPEIDWLLNEALSIYIKVIAEPRFRKPEMSGIDFNQRTINDLREIVDESKSKEATGIALTQFDDTRWLATLPTDYMFYTRGYVVATKDKCKGKLRCYEKSRGDIHEENTHYNSSFEWREINIETSGNNLVIYSDNTFTPSKLLLSYLRIPKYMHNAQDFGGSYMNADKTVTYTGHQNCELSSITHSEIVDLAVLITAGNILGDYQTKLEKLKLTQ